MKCAILIDFFCCQFKEINPSNAPTPSLYVLPLTPNLRDIPIVKTKYICIIKQFLLSYMTIVYPFDHLNVL